MLGFTVKAANPNPLLSCRKLDAPRAMRTSGPTGVASIAIFGFFILFLSAGATHRAAANDPPSDRPNIVFVFLDDHARQAIGAYGSVINETPNIDRLARQGMRFENVFVSNSICAPSRAVLLTGKHSHLNGQLSNRETFDGEQQTFPKLLRASGYNTAIIGKWHLGSDPTGFDHWEILPGQGSYYNPDFITPGGRHRETGYVTDIITDKCLEWLAEGRDPGKPFLLMYHHKAPHREWMPGPAHLMLYDGVDIPEPSTLFDDYATRGRAAREQEMEIGRHLFLGYDLKAPPDDDSPQVEHDMWRHNDYHRMNDEQRAAWNAAYGPRNAAFRQAGLEGRELTRWKYQRYIKDYLRTIASVDDNLGRMMDYLEESGLADNTIVIYTSDQGFYLGEHGWYDKRFIYEESLSTPMIVRWPGVTEPGSVNSHLVSNLDWAPTMLAMAGVEAPGDMQGRSTAPLLHGETPDDWRQSVYYHYYEFPAVHMVNRHYGVRTGRYKLARFYELEEWELYDLETDPQELRNRYGDPELAGIRGELKTELRRLQAYYKDDHPYASTAEIVQQRWKGRLADTPLRQVAAYERGEGQSRADLDPSFKTFTIGAHATPRKPNGALISQGGASNGYSLYLAEGVPSFAMRSGGRLYRIAADGPVSMNRQVHLAAMFDADAQMRLYVNGEPAAAGQGAMITSKPHVAFHVGNDPSSPVGEYDTPLTFEGDLRDIRVYWGVLDGSALRQWAR
jgi:arylsulfatase A-like enzyme